MDTLEYGDISTENKGHMVSIFKLNKIFKSNLYRIQSQIIAINIKVIHFDMVKLMKN